MKIKDVKKLPIEDRFMEWIRERESIRLKKNRDESKPWTDNEIMQKFKFCNVRRMDDRVSRWLLFNWYKPFRNHENMLTAVTLARHLNTTDTMDYVGFPDKWLKGHYRRELTTWKEDGNKVFSGAYMITGKAGRTKVDYILDVVGDVHRKRRKLMKGVTTLQELSERLQDIDGIGSFLSGQISSDMRHAVDGRWTDKLFWAPMGPGSRRGINRLKGRPINAPVKPDQFLHELGEFRELCRCNLHGTITNRLEAIDYQNCLCECDKMERTLFPDGQSRSSRPKQTYPGLE